MTEESLTAPLALSKVNRTIFFVPAALRLHVVVVPASATSVFAGCRRQVRDPDRNVPRATLYGTLATAVVYMLSLTAVFGILPTSQLANSTEPFSAAANAMFGGTWAGNVMAILVIVSGIGALNGWTMICAEMPLAAAKDAIFPARFMRMSKAGVPAFGIIASTTLGSIAMLVNYLGSSGATAFTTLILMTGITASIPYGFSALAQIKWRWTSFWVYWAPFFLAVAALLLGIPVYRRQSPHMTQPPPMPPYPARTDGPPNR